MKISPNVTLRLAKSQVAPTVFPTIVLLGASAVRLARQCPGANLIRGTTAVGHLYRYDGTSSTNKRLSGAPSIWQSETFLPVGLARRQRNGFNVMLRQLCCLRGDVRLWRLRAARRSIPVGGPKPGAGALDLR